MLKLDMWPYFYQITEPLLIQSYITLFCVASLFVLLLFWQVVMDFLGVLLLMMAVQSAHSGFVPRVGGLAIYTSILVLIPLLSFGFIPLSVVFNLNAGKITGLILSAIPVISVGLAEDLAQCHQKHVLLLPLSPVLWRFLLFKVWLTKLGIPGFDVLLTFAPFAIFFTVFATMGVAFNLIDVLNGLSSFVTISAELSLSIIAFESGNTQITIFLVLMVASVAGFMVFNFPTGKIFLGDGGAYALGHLLVWTAIILINQSMEISAFAILLIFFWPVADTGLAIWRRWKLGNPTDLPDRLHFHQLVMRFLEIRFFGRDKREITNPIATLVLIPMISTPQILGILFWDNFKATVWCSMIVGLLFVATYFTGIKIAKTSRGTNV